ncbi:hypothetical protein PPERSA_12962 [Pseudocohnilembus persalinus]|uniref:Uncharacterized protein n=1 Tax=Pseudocohnilembus persalinus TaxID=266149 RepID=A0A0V0R1X1_PSEPJ|nr:hypothetical protein PPERSA_12962 [Pseudocohnilembus persalinus]|eukprot:KRX08481.1 hypothetical protein PPERSA_12962 [Pseudocohnilembus persalinus]
MRNSKLRLSSSLSISRKSQKSQQEQAELDKLDQKKQQQLKELAEEERFIECEEQKNFDNNEIKNKKDYTVQNKSDDIQKKYLKLEEIHTEFSKNCTKLGKQKYEKIKELFPTEKINKILTLPIHPVLSFEKIIEQKCSAVKEV